MRDNGKAALAMDILERVLDRSEAAGAVFNEEREEVTLASRDLSTGDDVDVIATVGGVLASAVAAGSILMIGDSDEVEFGFVLGEIDECLDCGEPVRNTGVEMKISPAHSHAPPRSLRARTTGRVGRAAMG